MARSFDDARAAGVQWMECWATLTAEKFYQAVGFETVGPLDVTLQAGISFPSLRMTRTL